MSWLSALGGIAGSALSLGTSAYSMRKQYNYAKKLAEYTGSHAHQWEVSDLQAAGLNPILSAGGTGNAGSGMPSGLNADFSGLGQAANSAAAEDLAKAQIRAQDAQAAQSLTNAKLNEELTRKAQVEKDATSGRYAMDVVGFDANLAHTMADTRRLMANSGLADVQAQTARFGLDMDRANLDSFRFNRYGGWKQDLMGRVFGGTRTDSSRSSNQWNAARFPDDNWALDKGDKAPM
ncbi:minor capsid protein [Capybara microvirus Cap1_SP_209]|nr:minor capsid protein [Capybara microvirus Cap1_SP_209]